MENVSKLNTTLKQTNASWFPVPEAVGRKAAHDLRLIQTFQIRLQSNKGQGQKHPGPPGRRDNSCPQATVNSGTSF